MTESDDNLPGGRPPTAWDAASYHRLSAPRFFWGIQRDVYLSGRKRLTRTRQALLRRRAILSTSRPAPRAYAGRQIGRAHV